MLRGGVNSYSVQNQRGVQNSPNFRGAIVFECNNEKEAKRLKNNLDESTSKRTEDLFNNQQGSRVLSLWGQERENFDAALSLVLSPKNNFHIDGQSGKYPIISPKAGFEAERKLQDILFKRILQAYAQNAPHVDLTTKNGEEPIIYTGEA